MVGPDGEIIGADAKAFGPAAADIRAALDTRDDASGVFLLDSTPVPADFGPVLTPTPMGWVVFAARLDRAEMKSLEALSAIPIDAAVLHREPNGRWVDSEGARSAAVDRFIVAALAAKGGGPRRARHPRRAGHRRRPASLASGQRRDADGADAEIPAGPGASALSASACAGPDHRRRRPGRGGGRQLGLGPQRDAPALGLGTGRPPLAAGGGGHGRRRHPRRDWSAGRKLQPDVGRDPGP